MTGIVSPNQLKWDTNALWWPIKWGDHPLCGDDPCDDLHPLTWVHTLQQCRDERRPKPYYTAIRWRP
jgi:hypothetical protein